MSRFNKKDVAHNKENETTEQRGQRNFYKEEGRNSGEEKEGTAYKKEGCPNTPESCESCTKETVGSRGLAASTKKPTTEQSAK
ncbi:10986_t:CDS:2, partial [Gigaspora rosea]